jgi:small subunit ribosomal protein S20
VEYIALASVRLNKLTKALALRLKDHMPNTKSAKKELRKNIKRKAANLEIETKVKKLAKKSKKLIEAGEIDAASASVMETLKALDKAAQKGIIKKNTRDRKKSRLHKKLNEKMKNTK